MTDTPSAAPQRLPEPGDHRAVAQWLARFEAAAAACASRREASELLLTSPVARAERLFTGEPLRQLRVTTFNLYLRFWGDALFDPPERLDPEENNPP